LGLETNRGFLIDCLSHRAFAAGEISTAFIERHFPAPARVRTAPSGRMAALAAALIVEAAPCGGSDMLSHWRSSGAAAVPLLLRCGDARLAVEATREAVGCYRVDLAGESHAVELLALDPTWVRFLADGVVETARFAWDGAVLHLSLGGVVATFEDVLLAPRAAGAAATGAAVAPMTGTISAVRVKPGDAVRKGDCLVVLEAMKMEHEILAPRDGQVATVLVSPGQQVATRKLLVELAPAAE
jgi:geranyl-CoA carboxylase alpha subunit